MASTADNEVMEVDFSAIDLILIDPKDCPPTHRLALVCLIEPEGKCVISLDCKPVLLLKGSKGTSLEGEEQDE